jgi:WD40 repeat protein
LYNVHPGADTLKRLLDAIGGLEGATIATASGAFDVVTFDPRNHDRLLAAHRSSYGTAQNQATNEVWTVSRDLVLQRPWKPTTAYDFAHFNGDGTVTMWVRSGDELGFAPRIAEVLRDETTLVTTSSPMYASRFVEADSKVFALTGDGDYYSNRTTYVDLLVDDGGRQRVLADGAPYEWLDSPTDGVLIAYPKTSDGVTAVWDASTLARLPDHPLANRAYQRLAVSGDGKVAVGIRFDGQLENIDLSTGSTSSPFGSVNPVGVDRPITLNEDGTIAITVENFGLVTLWYMADRAPIARMAGDSSQPRLVRADRAASSSSVTATDASRLALRIAGLPTEPVHWRIIDTTVKGWIQRACNLAGRPLTNGERVALGLANQGRACSRQPCFVPASAVVPRSSPSSTCSASLLINLISSGESRRRQTRVLAGQVRHGSR